MKNPFADVQQPPDEIGDERIDELDGLKTKLGTCVDIISGMLQIVHSHGDRKLLSQLDLTLPNLDVIMKTIIDSTAGSTTTSSRSIQDFI